MEYKFPPMHNKDDKVYVIVGAPRSGTTFLARCIQKALVDRLGPGKGNRMVIEGNRISSVNAYVLDDAGGDIWTPPPHDEIMEAAIGREEMMEEFLDYMRQDFWGFKDPRTSFTLPAWLPHFNDKEDVYVIGIFRRPSRVVRSMTRLRQGRGDLNEMTREYNRRTLENIKRFLEFYDD